MKESRKVIMEQGQQDAYRRIILEQGYETDQDSNTPQWNKLKVSLKEGAAEKGSIFVGSFVSSIKPALIMGAVIIIAILLIIKFC